MRFLPREEKFYALFLDQVRLITESATLLQEGLHAGNSKLEQAAARITDLEHKADEILHEVFRRLNQTFITPIDPEDIHSLATRLDDVMDGIEELAHRVVAYKVEPIPAVAIDVSNDIVACVRALEAAFTALSTNGRLIEHCIEVNRIEEVVDVKVRVAMRELFEHERDPIRLIKLKEIYDYLEQTTDYCEDVSVALENVVVKNS